MKRLRLLTGISTVFLFSGLIVANSLAATSQANGFVVSPVTTEITVNKGQSETIQLSVQNPTNNTVAVKAVVNDFVASNDESGTPRLILNNSTPLPQNNFESLVAPIGNITLGPNVKQYINVTISVPQTAASGGYYGAIRFLPATSSNTANVGLTASVGSIFLITVPGNLIERLSLVQLSAADNSGNASSFLTSGKVSILTRLDNTGNIQVQPFGTVIIKNFFGHVVDEYQFNNLQPRANILPGSIRKFIDPLPNKSWFGRYSVESTIAYQQGSGNFITTKVSFYYFPLWFLISLIVLIALVIIWIYWMISRRRSAKPSRK